MGPNPSLLDPKLAIAQARPVLDIALPLLDEAIAYATNVFMRCETSATAGPSQPLPPLMLYRHILELIDGARVLIEASAPTPTLPLLRAEFEAWLSLEYMLLKDQEQRTRAWWCHYYHLLLKSAERQQLLPDIEALRRALTDTDLAAAEADMQARMAKRKGKLPNWYALFRGPPNLYELADHLGHVSSYDSLYRNLSSFDHAGTAHPYLEDTGSSITHVPLRFPKSIPMCTTLAVTILVSATRTLLEVFRPGENISRWYSMEISPRIKRLNEVTFEAEWLHRD